MPLLFQMIEWLIPNALKTDSYAYRKAKVLTYIHLILILLGIMLYFFELFIHTSNPVPIWLGIICGISLVILFKYNGNLVLAGNLVAAVFALPLTAYIPETGGIHSDNLLWLIVSPLVALLFANRRSGFFWLTLLLVFTFYLRGLDHQNCQIQTAHTVGNDSNYFFISYFFLFIIVYLIVVVFESGQLLTIQMINTQKAILQQQNDEIAQKNQELHAIEDRLRESILDLENFAYAASHDLKEPLRMINMYTQLLKKRLRGQLDESNTEFMGYVTEGVGRMQNLLDDLLRYSRLGKEVQDVRAVDLNNTLFLVIHNLTVAMKEANAEIVASPLPTVQASSVEMTQLFQNLIANAIKFRKKDAMPSIEIYVVELPNNEYEFKIIDNGIGIAEAHQQRVFNIFERLNARTNYDGSGIGLATCKKIVQNAGGDIWLESTEGVGTTFFFTLPKLNIAN